MVLENEEQISGKRGRSGSGIHSQKAAKLQGTPRKARQQGIGGGKTRGTSEKKQAIICLFALSFCLGTALDEAAC